MKKILTVAILLMLSALASAQMKLWLNEISETEIDPDYRGGINTMEGYVKPFIDVYGISEFNKLLTIIDSGRVESYIQYLNDLGEKRFVEEVNYIKTMLWGINGCKLYFISNAKLYVITYDKADYKSLYLYRRDADGWKIASDLIRKDEFVQGEYMKRFDSRTTRWNESDTLYTLENHFFGEVHKISGGSVYVTFGTEIWYPQGKGYTYNSILVFVPDRKETYHVSYFEPENKQGKILKNVINHNYNYSKRTWSSSSVTTKFPVLSGIRNTEYGETDNGEGLTIKYWDGTTDNPIEAGTLKFKVVNGFITYNGTIVLNRIKW